MTSRKAAAQVCENEFPTALLRDVVDGLPIGTPTRAYVICELPLL